MDRFVVLGPSQWPGEDPRECASRGLRRVVVVETADRLIPADSMADDRCSTVEAIDCYLPRPECSPTDGAQSVPE